MKPELRTAFARYGMYTAGFMAVVNVSVMYLAVPRIESTLGGGIADQQWILSIYPLMEGGFTLAGGTLGDLYGRKRVLAAGTWLFLLATLACALAPTVGALIVARGVQGIASAPLLSLPIAILIEMLSDPADNMQTVKNFATVAGLAAGLAPLIGGALVHWFGWPAIFYFSAVLALLVLAGTACCPEDCARNSQPLDVPGQLLSVLACLSFTFALIEGNAAGWNSALILTAFGVAVAAFAFFFAAELRSKSPMMNLRYFRLRMFDVSIFTLGAVNFAWYGIMLLSTLFLQHVLHSSPLEAGLYLMPCNVAYFAVNLLSGRIEQRLGAPASIALSFAVSLGGMAWLSMLTASSAAWQAAAALGVCGIGWGIICTPATAFGMAAVRANDEGFASGTLALSRSLFGVFGIAVLGSLLTGGMSHALRGPLSALVHHGKIFEHTANAANRAAIHGSYVHAFRFALEVCFAFTLLCGIAAAALSARRAPLPIARSEFSS